MLKIPSANRGYAYQIGLVIEEINWENLKDLSAACLNADTFMVVYNYLYKNVIANYLGILKGLEQDELIAFDRYADTSDGKPEGNEVAVGQTAEPKTEPGSDDETTTETGATDGTDNGDNDNVSTGDVVLPAVIGLSVLAGGVLLLAKKRR